MKLPGSCEKCHQIKRVRVSNAGMARLAQRQIPIGICDGCQDAEDERRRPNPRQHRL